ncbi:regulatory protein RecX [candidate division WWE3 bacterium]|uniref:Regulatory protein RecX n=1 Tax=candidate division WWE3 bacterium TaxID=2053526 RepID=A0A7X9DJW0_UNCKA|nr:regulatory protein RecX [candidate division WWE3 bacterium]
MGANKDFDLLYFVALRFLAHKPRTEYEVLQKLLSYQKNHNLNTDESVNSAVIELLKREKYINDREYVNQYISYQAQAGKKSLLVLQKFLLKKGVDKSQIKTTLAEYKGNDLNTAKTLASKKLRSFKGKDISPEKLRQKLLAFLLGKGLPFDDSSDAVDSLLGVK